MRIFPDADSLYAAYVPCFSLLVGNVCVNARLVSSYSTVAFKLHVMFFLFQYRLVQNPGTLTISYTKELTSGNPEWKLNISHLAMTVNRKYAASFRYFRKNFTF